MAELVWTEVFMRVDMRGLTCGLICGLDDFSWPSENLLHLQHWDIAAIWLQGKFDSMVM